MQAKMDTKTAKETQKTGKKTRHVTRASKHTSYESLTNKKSSTRARIFPNQTRKTHPRARALFLSLAALFLSRFQTKRPARARSLSRSMFRGKTLARVH
jgi:hypothetical protein